MTGDDNRSLIREIRGLRSSPPHLAASDDDRRGRFAAGLEQFEQLLEASSAVGPAARPLPLFYALAQGGYAIAAARLERDKGQLRAAHGLEIQRPVPRSLEMFMVKPNTRGAFQDVAEATGSPSLTVPTSAARLWLSLPDSAGKGYSFDNLPPALLLIPNDQAGPSAGFVMTAKAGAGVYGLPFAKADKAELAAFLAQYPTAVGWKTTTDDVHVGDAPGLGRGTRLFWEMEESTGSAAERIEFLLTKVAPRYEYRNSGWLRPSVNAAQEHPNLLMTWWALLFGLSMLARYHPKEWMGMLEVDRLASEAVLIETILEEALVSLPRVVLGSLTS